MKVEKLHSTRTILAQLILLCIPSVIVGSYILWHLNLYYTVLNNQWLTQTLYFSIGLIAGCLFYNHRFRFISTFLPLLLFLYLVSIILNHVFTGEFSAFYVSAQFFIFSFLLIIGIITGLGFARFRYFPILLSVLILIIQIIVVSKTTDISAQKLILAFVPVLFCALYLIYTAELIRNMDPDEPSFTWFIGKRLGAFSLLSLLILFILFSFYNKQFKAIEKEFGSAANQSKEDNRESLTNQDKDGSVSNKKSMGLSGGTQNSKKLVFIAKLDNYFPGTQDPNPLYFTYDYFTKFDTLTQTLETDSLMPSNDLFQPDPSAIPLYFTQTDSTVLVKAKSSLNRKVVTTEVYKALLSPKEFLAPATAFFCQPISVEKEYKQQFKSAYRAKMYVSELNSAYFVYNPAGNTTLEAFQQARFKTLRAIKNWNGEDAAFMNYYTFIPRSETFDTIRTLAQTITKNAKAPIDKIIAIRDYFFSKDENGQPLFQYSDNPGIPGLPGASKLNYFLLENRKGYCAYYAGATLFLLRSLGIPSRISTGFLTVDRADKNKGWYWFYADQAHAWVQVYFPGYGWLDFDTTIPSTEQQQAPAPDGTPPITVQSAYFIANGKVVSIDTSAKRMQMEVTKLIVRDKPYTLAHPVSLNMDISFASVSKDTGAVPLSTVTPGIQVTSLSFSEQLKSLVIPATADANEMLAALPKILPIDEIRILNTEKENKLKKQIQPTKTSYGLLSIIKSLLIIVGLLLLLVFLLPYFIYLYFRYNATHEKLLKRRTYFTYTSAMYLLNQLGYSREEKTPLRFAETSMSSEFGDLFESFIKVYLKSKYSGQLLSKQDEAIITSFLPSFTKRIRSKISVYKQIIDFLHIYRTINYFTRLKHEHGE